MFWEFFNQMQCRHGDLQIYALLYALLKEIEISFYNISLDEHVYDLFPDK